MLDSRDVFVITSGVTLVTPPRTEHGPADNISPRRLPSGSSQLFLIVRKQ